MGQLVSLRLGLQTQVVTQWVWVWPVSGQIPSDCPKGKVGGRHMLSASCSCSHWLGGSPWEENPVHPLELSREQTPSPAGTFLSNLRSQVTGCWWRSDQPQERVLGSVRPPTHPRPQLTLNTLCRAHSTDLPVEGGSHPSPQPPNPATFLRTDASFIRTDSQGVSSCSTLRIRLQH